MTSRAVPRSSRAPRAPALAAAAAQVPRPESGSGGLVTNARDFFDLALDTAFRLVPRVALALMVLLAFVGLSLVITLLLRRVFARTHLEKDVADLLLTLARYVVIGFGAMVALENLGFNVTSVIAGLGIAGIALGFAAKDSLANFIAGITILWDRPFRVGDRIDVAGSTGIVRKITLRTTRLDTVRNEVVILPNQTMVTEKIVNHTMRPSLRVDVPFGIAYGEDVKAAREVVLATVAGDDAVRPKPEPAVVVTELASSSVNMELRVWLKDPRTEIQARLRYLEKVKAALDAAGIEIPFPQVTVHVGDEPEFSAAQAASAGVAAQPTEEASPPGPE
ncbi:MAG: mechanosensitive ion channel family protein [Gemmatimonadota bacterium]